MSDVLMEAIAELTRQSRELAARVSQLEGAIRDHEERLAAQGVLLASPHRRDCRDAVRHYEAQLAQAQEAA